MGQAQPSDDDTIVAQIKGMAQSLSSGLSGSQELVDKAIDGVSGVVKQSAAALTELSSSVIETGKDVAATGAAHLEQGEEELIQYLKRGVVAARENEIATASVLGLLALSLPGPRRLIWKFTLGRLRSVEAAEKSAEARFSSLSESITKYQDEVRAAERQVYEAQDQVAKAQSSLKSAVSKIRSLASQVSSTEKSALGLIQDLRDLPTKKALELRSQAAQRLSDVSKQRTVLEKQIYALEKQGL